MNMMGELRKRHIVQIALLYLGAAWLFIEIAEFIVGEYGFSRRILDSVVLLAILGLPAFLIVGWYHGERGHQRVQRGEVWLLTTLGVLAAIGTYQIATAEYAPHPVESAAPAAGPGGDTDAELASDGPVFEGPSLAVVPFTNNLAGDDLAWMGPGVADLFTTNFAQLEWLRVVGRQRLYDLLTEEGRGESERIPESLASTVARSAGAEMMLWGTISGSADDIVIDAQMIDLETGAVRAAERLRGSDVFVLVDSLTTRLLDRLREGRPRPSNPRTRVSAMGTKDLEALAAFQNGLSLERQGLAEEARVEFERSLEMDSTFVLPAFRLASRAAAQIYTFAADSNVGVHTNLNADTTGVEVRGGPGAVVIGDRSDARARDPLEYRERILRMIRRLGDEYEIDLQGMSVEDFVVRMDSTLELALGQVEVGRDSARRRVPPP